MIPLSSSHHIISLYYRLIVCIFHFLGHTYRAELLHAVGRPIDAIEELLRAQGKNNSYCDCDCDCDNSSYSDRNSENSYSTDYCDCDSDRNCSSLEFLSSFFFFYFFCSLSFIFFIIFR